MSKFVAAKDVGNRWCAYRDGSDAIPVCRVPTEWDELKQEQLATEIADALTSTVYTPAVVAALRGMVEAVERDVANNKGLSSFTRDRLADARVVLKAAQAEPT